MFLALVAAAALSAPNIVLISVDTLRPDHLGFYGHPANTSPHLDRLAAQSLVFDDAVCEVPLTAPSFCAMMTSRYPRATGVTRNGIRLGDDVPTVAESFQAAGYQTLCVTSNWTLRGKMSGLNRGFDQYDDSLRNRRWVVFTPERGADDVTDRAIAQLKARDIAKPFFAWFHYSDPHAPYEDHEGFAPSAESAYPNDPGAREKIRYDSEIAYTDAQIQRLLDALPRENTAVVFLADHGESLREHGYLGHGRRLYDSGLRIPLFIHAPGIVAPGRNNAPVRGVDIGPTLLALAGLPPVDGMQGIALTLTMPPRDRVRLVEAYGGAVLHLPGAEGLMARAGPELQAAIYDGWKLIVGRNDTELYHLANDRGEMHNLADQAPARASALQSAIDHWADSVQAGNAADANLTQDDVEALKSLGYTN